MDLDNVKEWLPTVLKNCQASVTFTKKDGTERVMLCTLKEDKIVTEEKKTDRVKKENTDILAVWDLDNNAWRSFRYDSIKHVELVIE